jgi:hypothetical protein
MMSSVQSRYKLLNATNLKQRPYLPWLVKGVLPAKGLAVIYGPSGSGKSFLSLDLAASIAEGKSWFGRRVNSAPVVYLALEGEDGIRQRTEAWVQHNGEPLPNNLQFILQPFKLSDAKDVDELAKVLPKGCVLIIDTLSKASSTSDENTSHDMGVLTDAAKRLQVLTDGLVLLIHHTGKNESAGMRGHSSLSATIDASIQVSRQGSLRHWTFDKVKDGADGVSEGFKLLEVELGIDADGDPITSCVVQRDNSVNFNAPMPQGQKQIIIWETLKPMFDAGVLGISGVPPEAICIRLDDSIKAGAEQLPCSSDKKKTRSKDAIKGLISRGLLEANEGWVWKPDKWPN